MREQVSWLCFMSVHTIVHHRSALAGKLGCVPRAKGPLINFGHIPKTAGKSMKVELRERRYEVTKASRYEPCFRDTYCNDAIHVTMLRSPRAHVFSMYLECRQAPWGMEVTQNTSFPRHGSVPSDFEAWVDHFLRDGGIHGLGTTGAFNCYNPWNLQTRALSCQASSPGPIGWGETLHRPNNSSDLKPSLLTAVETLESQLNIAGLTELYHETWCVLDLWATGGLPQECNCAKDMTDSMHLHITHGVSKHSWVNLPPRLLRKIDALSVVDVELYKVAARQFLGRIAAEEQRLGAKFLCPARLASFRQQTKYLKLGF